MFSFSKHPSLLQEKGRGVYETTGLVYPVEFVEKPHDYCYWNSILGGG